MKENVYLFRQKGTDFVKIGMTKNESVYLRFSHFCTYAPNGGEIVGVIKTNNSLVLEKEIHRKYESKRLNGEFFMLTQNECENIIRTYSLDLYNEALTQFNLLLSDENIDILSIIKELKKLNYRPKRNEEDLYNNIVSFFEKGSKNDFYTATEAYKMYVDKFNTNVNSKLFGKMLKRIFGENKPKRIGNSVSRVYFIKLKNEQIRI